MSTSPTPRGRVLISKLGLDGHDVGAKVVARILRDAGFEVIYLGIRQTPEDVAQVAADEDVDLIGISLLSGAHLALTARLMHALDAAGVDAPVALGGVVPEDDRPALRSAGVAAIFDAATTTADVVHAVAGLIDARS